MKLRCLDSWEAERARSGGAPDPGVGALPPPSEQAPPSLSVGEASVRLLMEEERLMAEATDRELGYWLSSPSSAGRLVSTMASRQLTNNSALSKLVWLVEKGPANLHSPPKPQVCR